MDWKEIVERYSELDWKEIVERYSELDNEYESAETLLDSTGEKDDAHIAQISEMMREMPVGAHSIFLVDVLMTLFARDPGIALTTLEMSRRRLAQFLTEALVTRFAQRYRAEEN